MGGRGAGRVGLIARADCGGLGNLTYEVARNLRPDATLVMMMGGAARGPERPWRFGGEVGVAEFGQDVMTGMRWLVEQVDVIYTAETPYDRALYDLARESGARVVVHAMPELLDEETVTSEHGASVDEVWLPSSWRAAEVGSHVQRWAPGATVRLMPVPVALDRFVVPSSARERPRRFLHVGGPAMEDRAGSALLAEAIRACESTFTIAAVHAPRLRATGRVRVEHLDPPIDYWQLYEDVDAVIAPRRYGGLSLVAQEAAGAGVPVVTLDREPDVSWPHAIVAPGSTGRHAARMKGGLIPVAQGSARALAATLDRLVGTERGAREVAARGEAGRRWAVEHSWAALRPGYEAAFAG